jgi:ATP-binding cassette, subfamily B, bacterial PglK
MGHPLLKILSVLNPAQKRRGLFIVGLLAVQSVMDFFSIAFFLPLVIMLVKPDATFMLISINDIYAQWGIGNAETGLLVLTIFIVSFIFIKILANEWIVSQKARFAYKVAADMASRVLAKYLNGSYSKFSNVDYTREMNHISNIPLIFANNIIIPAGTIMSEGLVATLLIAGIALYNAKVLVFLSLLLVPIYFISRWRGKRIKTTGERLKDAYPGLLKHTLQTVESWIEIKTFRKEHFFRQRFDKSFEKVSHALAADHTINTASARISELVVASFIGVLICYALLSNQSYQETLILLTIYGGVSLRITPSINRLFSASAQIRANEYAIKELEKIIDQKEPENGEVLPLTFEDRIELVGISASYTGKESVLHQISLTIKKGERMVISGPSGTGKTTLLLILMRFLKETEGDFYIDGVRANDESIPAWRKLFAYVSQNPYIMDASISENIAFGQPPEQIDASKIDQILTTLDLASWVDNLPEKSGTVIGERGMRISGGQRQRVAIARALYHETSILLLDEITNQLDRDTEREIVATISKLSTQNKTIIVVTHQPDLWTSFDTRYHIIENHARKIQVEQLQS